MRAVASVFVAMVVAAGLAGCGGSDGDSGASHSEADIIAALGVESEGPNWVDPQNGCKVATALTSENAVALYRDAGDAVATNPSGSVGVKVFAGPSTSAEECVRIFEERLAKL